MQFMLPRVFGWAEPFTPPEPPADPTPDPTPVPALARWYRACEALPAFAQV